MTYISGSTSTQNVVLPQRQAGSDACEWEKAPNAVVDNVTTLGDGVSCPGLRCGSPLAFCTLLTESGLSLRTETMEGKSVTVAFIPQGGRAPAAYGAQLPNGLAPQRGRGRLESVVERPQE